MPNRITQIKTEVENQYPGSVLKKRVENGLIFQRPDGVEEHRYTTGPWHWRQRDTNEWIEIDTDLENSGDATWKHHIKSAKFDTLLTDDGRRRFYPRRWITTEYVEFGNLEWKALNQWRTVPTGVMSRIGNRLVGEDRTTHKFETGFSGRGSRTNLTLKNSTVSRSIRWQTTLIGLTWDVNERSLISQSDSTKVGFLLPPTWTDSSTAPQKHEIPWEYSNSYFTLTPDFTDAVYPIVVDPNYSIAAGADDGNENPDFDSFSATDTSSSIGNSGGSPNYEMWFRFANITAAQGADCTAATITCVTSQNGNGTDMKMLIAAVDEDDHAAPTSNATWDTDHAIHTTAVVHWDFATKPTTGNTLTTADFSSVIDEILARAGWTSGYDIGIHLDDDGCAAYAYRTLATYENTTYTEPVLSLTLASGAKPQINIGDTWKQSTAISINIGDTWKSVTAMKINIGDTWKTVFTLFLSLISFWKK